MRTWIISLTDTKTPRCVLNTHDERDVADFLLGRGAQASRYSVAEYEDEDLSTELVSRLNGAEWMDAYEQR